MFIRISYLCNFENYEICPQNIQQYGKQMFSQKANVSNTETPYSFKLIICTLNLLQTTCNLNPSFQLKSFIINKTLSFTFTKNKKKAHQQSTVYPLQFRLKSGNTKVNLTKVNIYYQWPEHVPRYLYTNQSDFVSSLVFSQFFEENRNGDDAYGHFQLSLQSVSN